MNSKTIMRRTMPLIIALAVIIIIAVSCTILTKNKRVPSFNEYDPDGVFLEAGDVIITNRQIYEDLKSQMGIGTLVDMLDKQLLKQLKNANNQNYYDAVSEEEIDEAIEKDKFPDGRTGDEEKDQKTEENWEKGMFLYGYTTEELIRENFRLTLARRHYVRDRLEKEYLDSLENDDDDDDTITGDDIEDYYDDNYTKSYWTVVVGYYTLEEAEAALSQLNIVVKQKEVNGKKVDTWFDARTDKELTADDIMKAFIDLYNNRYSNKAKNYPNANPLDNLVVREGVHYTLVDGKIVFNTTLVDEEKEYPQEDKNLFYYTKAELDKLDKGIASYVEGLDAYLAEGSELLQSFSVKPKTWTNADNYYYVFKIQYQDPVDLEDVKDEIIEKILDERLDQTGTIKKELAELRREYKDFLIYDPVLEAAYISGYDSTFPKTNKESKNLVARFNGVEYSVDQLFKQLSVQYGPLSVIDFYNYESLLYSEYNKIYEYKGKHQEGKVLDKKAWKDIEFQVETTKRNFSNGVYESSGYPRTYGWKNFLRDYYINNYGIMVEDEHDLKMYFLYQKVIEEFKDQTTKTTQTLWDEIYAPQMQKMYDEFLSAQGYHLLIFKEDAEGKPTDPETWTDYEREIAQELYDEILAELKTKRTTKMRKFLETEVIEAYENTPRFVAHLPQDIASQPKYSEETDWIIPDAEDYRFAKYKTAGLKVKFESLTITAGKMVKPFEEAVREIWNEAEANDNFGSNIVVYDKSYEKDYIVTEYGYHIYVNTQTTKRPNTTVNGETVILTLPSLDLVKRYEEFEENDLDSDLTRAEEQSIKQYFTPIRDELRGSNYTQLQFMYMTLENLDSFKFTDPDVNKENQVERIVQFYIDTYYDSLKYVKNPNEQE